MSARIFHDSLRTTASSQVASGRVRFARRSLATLLIAAFLPIATGCFGSFQLTRRVYKFNEEVTNDKWLRWGAFLGLNIIPVYGFATLFDAVFANSVEFWSGENPMAASISSAHVIEGSNGERIASRPRSDGSLDFWMSSADGSEYFVNMSRSEGWVVARDASGEELGRVTEIDGRMFLKRPSD